MTKQKGWKSLPASLKIIFILLFLWIIGSLFAISSRYDQGVPFFGLYIYGITAALIVLILDIIFPLIFLIGLFQRKSWTVKFAFIYMGIFILNSIFALFTVREQFGLTAILIPPLVYTIFLIFIYRNKKYFK